MQRLSPKEGTVPLSYRYYYYYYLCIVYDRVYHATPPPAPIFHCLYLHSSNSAGAKKESAVETSRRAELSGDVSFGVGTLLVVEQTSLEKTPQGGVIYIQSYTVFISLSHTVVVLFRRFYPLVLMSQTRRTL